ncbi:histidine kinase [Natrinema sp. CBA1119]|uniref:PAS domain-containing sensor histidine kinase n=1 Tax=Natrinema sp. CBA1119 TaxID=1608465 RepID=UPI000BF4028D|nr:PAS domain S-box protein [Natrinema sp. CBA1119]PGF16726.1 histidine kinase [Natrinema sp. CBA1119]
MDSGPSNDPSAAADESETGSFPDRMAGLLEAADIARFRATPSGTIVDGNDAFTRLTGYARTELDERPFDALFDDGTSLESLVSELDEGSTSPTSTPVSIRTKTGSVPCTVHLDRRPRDDADQEPTIDGIVRRRRAPARSAAAASDSDLTYGRTFEALANALPDGIIVLDTDSDIQYANPAVERILGHDPDELVGSSKVEIIPERLRQTHLSALQRYLETGERNINWTYVELPGQHADGREVPLGVSLNDFTFDGDRYFVGLFRDISPRKEAERTLTEKVVQLESVSYLGRHALENPDVDDMLEKATELVASALDAEYAIVFEHDADGPDGEVLRLRAGTGLGVVEDETTPAADSIAAAALTDDGPIVIEDLESDPRFDGPSLVPDRDVRSGITVAIGPKSDPWGVLDVYDTDRREFADHDVDFLESVATIIATAIERQGYERRLNETVSELEASNERLEQFAYAASHDLQEPLRMVSSYLQLIERRYADELDADGREFIDYAVDGANRMSEMIDGLLEYSRIDSQGDPFEPVDLDAVLEDVLTDLQMMVERSDAEIAAEPLPKVQGDPHQLRQLFQNLLSNAIEYSGDEPPREDITAERSGGTWEISVRDEGIGIDPDERDRVFRVFQRLHSREEYEGTGIGLALCRRIVERHGGEIWVDAEPGEGSTFTVTIPVNGSR